MEDARLPVLEVVLGLLGVLELKDVGHSLRTSRTAPEHHFILVVAGRGRGLAGRTLPGIRDFLVFPRNAG